MSAHGSEKSFSPIHNSNSIHSQIPQQLQLKYKYVVIVFKAGTTPTATVNCIYQDLHANCLSIYMNLSRSQHFLLSPWM
jgi:hypothetical protein